MGRGRKLGALEHPGIGWIVALVLTTLAFLAALSPNRIAPSESLFTQQASSKENPVVFSAWLEPGEIERGFRGRLEVRVVNQSGEPIRNLRLERLYTGILKAEEICWRKGDSAACESADPGQPAQVSVLQPGENATLAVGLAAVEAVGGANVRVTAVWSGQSANEERMSLTLGPVSIMGWAERFSRQYLQRFLDLLKDLILPLGAAFLAWFLPMLQKRADERRQVLVLQLPRFLEYVEQHYMPIANACRRLGDELKKNMTAPSHVSRECVFLALLLLRRMRRLRDEKGGIFFLQAGSERIFQRTWRVIQENLETALGRQAVENNLMTVTPQMTFGEFERVHVWNSDIETMRLSMAEWAVEPARVEDTRKLLNLLYALIDLETMRPLAKHWYETELTQEASTLQREFDAARPVLAGILDDAIVRQLTADQDEIMRASTRFPYPA